MIEFVIRYRQNILKSYKQFCNVFIVTVTEKNIIEITSLVTIIDNIVTNN